MSKETPLVSVIIPIYNIKKYLERCVQSVCKQTYRNLEIILVDDGSTDGTEKLCDELARQDDRIRVFHKENGGSSTARNLGIANARGEYYGFVDSDDYISETMYELLVKAIEKNRAEIAQTGRDEIDEEGNYLPNICTPPEKEEFISSTDFLKELLLHRGDCSFCTKLISARLFQNRQFPVGELNEDFKLLVQMLQEVNGVVSLPAQNYHVCYRIGSNTRKRDKNDFSRVFLDCVNNADMAEELVNSLKGMEKDEKEELKKIAARFGLFQRLEYLLHIPIGQMTKENEPYRQICRYVKKHWPEAIKNPYLTGKNKVYLTLFAAAPRTIRVFHGKMKGL